MTNHALFIPYIPGTTLAGTFRQSHLNEVGKTGDGHPVKEGEGVTMNAIALFLLLVLQGNPTCPAETPNFESVEGQLFQIQVYDCYWRGAERPSHQFVVMSPVCPTYIGQPTVIKEAHERKGWVMNRFGEFYPASVNIDMMEMYRPPC